MKTLLVQMGVVEEGLGGMPFLRTIGELVEVVR